MKYKKFQHNQKSEGLPQGPNYRQTNEFISTYGYSDFSPFRNQEYLDIYSPNGVIDMSNTGIPLLANGGRYLPPYSGLHQFDTPWIREEKFEQGGAYLPKADIGLETPPKNNNVFDIDAFTNKTNELDQLFKQGTVDESDPLVQDALKEMWSDSGFDSKSSIFQNKETGEYDPSKVYKTAWSGATINELTKSLFGKPQWSTAHAKAMKKMYSGESAYDKPFNLESSNTEFEVGDVLGRGRKGWKDWKVDDFEKSFAKGEKGQLSHFDIIVGKGKDSKGTYYETAGGNRSGTAGGTFKKSKVYYDPETKKLKNSNYIFGSNVKDSYRGVPLDEGASDQVVTEGSAKKPADSRGYTDEQRDEYLRLLQSDGVNTQQQRQPIATNIPMIPMNQNMQPRFSNVTADMIKNRRGPLGGRKFKAKNISISQKGGPTYDFTNNQLAQREVGGDYLDNSYKNSKLYNMGGNIQNQSIDTITSQNADRFKNYLLDTSNQYKMNEMQKLIQESSVSPEMMMNPQGYMEAGGNWLDAYNQGMANQQNLFTSGINDMFGSTSLVDSNKVKVGRKKGLDKTLGTKWFEFGEKGRRNRAAKDSFGMAAQNLGYLNEGYNNRDIKKLGMKNYMDISRQMAAGRDDQGNIISPDMYAGAYGQSYYFPMAYGGVPPMMNYGGDYYDYRNGGAYLPIHQGPPGEYRQLTQEELDELEESTKYATNTRSAFEGLFNPGESAESVLKKANKVIAENKRIAENKEKNRKWRNNQAGNYRSVADQFDIWSNMKAGEASDAINEYFGWDGAGNSGFTKYAEDLDQYYKWLENKKGPYDVSYPMGASPTVSSIQVGDPEAQALLNKKNAAAAEAKKLANTPISETKQQALIKKAQKQVAEVQKQIQANLDAAKNKKDKGADKVADKVTEDKVTKDKGADEVAVNPNAAPTYPGGWQYSPFFNAGKIVNRKGPLGGSRLKMKDVSWGYTPSYAGVQSGMAAPQSDLDPRLQDYYMNNANRVVNPRQSVDPRDPRSGGFGDRLREGVANVAGGIRDRFSDIRANRQDRRGQLINEYLNYDPTPPDPSIDPAFQAAELPQIQQEGRTNQDIRDDIQQQIRLNKGERMYEADRKRAARAEERDLAKERDLIDDVAYKGIRSGKKEARKRDRLLKKEARLNRRGSKAYGGEQYYGAGGPFGHIPMQDYGMGGGLRKYQGTTLGSEVDDDFGWNDNDTLGWNDSYDKSVSGFDPNNSSYSNFKFKPNAGSAFQQVLKAYPNLSPSDTLYSKGDPRDKYAFTFQSDDTDALMDAAEATYGDIDMGSIWDDQEEKQARITYDFTKTPEENRVLLNNRYGGLRKFQNTGESREDELYNNLMNEQKRVAELTNPERLKKIMDENVGRNIVKDFYPRKYNQMCADGSYGCAQTSGTAQAKLFGFTQRDGTPIRVTAGTASFANPKHYEKQGYELLSPDAELQPGDVWNKATKPDLNIQGHQQIVSDPKTGEVVHNPGNIRAGLIRGNMQNRGSGNAETKAYRYTGFQDEMQDELMDYVHNRPLERISTNPVNTLANNIDRRPMETYGTRSTDNLAAFKLGQEVYLDGGQVEEMIKKGYKIQYF